MEPEEKMGILVGVPEFIFSLYIPVNYNNAHGQFTALLEQRHKIITVEYFNSMLQYQSFVV